MFDEHPFCSCGLCFNDLEGNILLPFFLFFLSKLPSKVDIFNDLGKIVCHYENQQ